MKSPRTNNWSMSVSRLRNAEGTPLTFYNDEISKTVFILGPAGWHWGLMPVEDVLMFFDCGKDSADGTLAVWRKDSGLTNMTRDEILHDIYTDRTVRVPAGFINDVNLFRKAHPDATGATLEVCLCRVHQGERGEDGKDECPRTLDCQLSGTSWMSAVPIIPTDVIKNTTEHGTKRKRTLMRLPANRYVTAPRSVERSLENFDPVGAFRYIMDVIYGRGPRGALNDLIIKWFDDKDDINVTMEHCSIHGCLHYVVAGKCYESRETASLMYYWNEYVRESATKNRMNVLTDSIRNTVLHVREQLVEVISNSNDRNLSKHEIDMMAWDHFVDGMRGSGLTTKIVDLLLNTTESGETRQPLMSDHGIVHDPTCPLCSPEQDGTAEVILDRKAYVVVDGLPRKRIFKCKHGVRILTDTFGIGFYYRSDICSECLDDPRPVPVSQVSQLVGIEYTTDLDDMHAFGPLDINE